MSVATDAVDGAIRNALGDEATGLTHAQQFARLSQKIVAQASSPEAMMQHHSDVIGTLGSAHPELGQALAAQMATTVQHLSDILPKPKTTASPFQSARDYQPSHAELHEFKKRLAVMNDPIHVMDELKDGTLTAGQIATAQIVHPAILGRIQSEIGDEANAGTTALPYDKRVQLSLLAGQPMDPALKNLSAIQSIYGATPAPQPQGSPGSGPVSKNGKFNMSTDRETNAQRLAGYGGG